MQTLKVIRANPVVFPLALLSAAAMLFISEGSYRESVTTLDQLVSDTEARASILDLRKNILDAETGQRGYLLTGRVEYLAPYDHSIGPIEDLFRVLDIHYRSNPKAKPLIGKLREHVKARLSLIAETIRLKQEGKPDLAAELVLTGFEKEQMDEIQNLGNDLLAQGTLSVAESRHDIDGTLMLGRLGVVVLTAICLIALIVYVRHRAMAEAVQRDLSRTIQAERDQLEVVVARRTMVLTQLTHHLQTAREDERHQIGRAHV